MAIKILEEKKVPEKYKSKPKLSNKKLIKQAHINIRERKLGRKLTVDEKKKLVKKIKYPEYIFDFTKMNEDLNKGVEIPGIFVYSFQRR